VGGRVAGSLLRSLPLGSAYSGWHIRPIRRRREIESRLTDEVTDQSDLIHAAAPGIAGGGLGGEDEGPAGPGSAAKQQRPRPAWPPGPSATRWGRRPPWSARTRAGPRQRPDTPRSGKTAAPPSPGGVTEGCSLAGSCRTVIHFSTPTAVHSYTVVDLRVMQIVHRSIHRSSHCPAPSRRDRGKLARLPRDRLRARGTNGQGTRQDPPHQGHPQAGPRRHARWQVPAHAGPDGPPCAGHWRQRQGNGLPAEPSKPRAGTGRAGLALAPPPAGNCAVSGRQGGLACGVCTRDQRWPAGWRRPCDRGHGAHRASRRSTAGMRHPC